MEPVVGELERGSNILCEIMQNRQKDMVVQNFFRTERQNYPKMKEGVFEAWDIDDRAKGGAFRTEPSEET
jgi:hypothetical protein